ncbi:MAG: hypothetical protein Q8M07_07355 [Prosthecobacter sp.]|nr:hypothetical protein [Prosthecobacter sp.]
MTKKKPPFAFSAIGAFKCFEMLLAIFLFAHGSRMLNLGWVNPRHVGWVPSGALLMIGGVACAWLVWQRRGTQRATTAPMMFFMTSANLVEGILKWRAKEEEAEWPTAYCVLVVLFLFIIIWEEVIQRRQAAKDSTRESKWFDEEDRI